MVGTIAMIGGFPLVLETSRKARETNVGKSLAVAALIVLGFELAAFVVYAGLSIAGVKLP